MNYHELNALINLFDEDGKLQLEKDKEAAREYFLQHVNQNTVFFHTIEEKLDYLFENDYYDKDIFDNYSVDFVKQLYKQAYSHKFRFPTFLGALKYYTSYTLKTFDGSRYLERYEDRVVAVALTLAVGDEETARKLVDDIITGVFQPATPTFNNAGKKQRGEYVSCFLLDVQDNMESISRAIVSSLQLSKRGGGVALNLSNLRAEGDPIKKIKGQSSGVIPVMKLLEDSFSYANQLGSRDGAGAVYLHAMHLDIYKFIDVKRNRTNADEKIQVKSLSIGVVIPDIVFELAKNNEDMYMFSPYDVERIYGVPFAMIDFTNEYRNLVANPDIRKESINTREFMAFIASTQSESGYPYIMFEDNVNKVNPLKGKITMSNLCVEILQVSEPSTHYESLIPDHVGKDISCNLGSMNIAKAMETGFRLGKSVETAIRGLTAVSDLSYLKCVPSIVKGNEKSHAIGLGQMNLHGFLAQSKIHYDSPEAVDFTDAYFRTILFYALKASMNIAKERNMTFEGFRDSKYATGEFFEPYLQDFDFKTWKVKTLFAEYGVSVPTVEEWKELQSMVMQYGLYNQNLQAVPPTGSISYINNSTASIHPIAARIEARKEGKIGRVYYPVPGLSEETWEYFKDAYEIDPKAVIDVYAAAQQHVDQGLSLTLFLPTEATTRDFNRIHKYAWEKGIKTLYYVRRKKKALEGTESEGCVSCSL